MTVVGSAVAGVGATLAVLLGSGAAAPPPHRSAEPGGAVAAHSAAASGARAPSDERLLGQRIMVGVSGTYPSRALLRAVQAGDVGSVILFKENIVNRSQVKALTGALQRAARRGGNPPLLISTDQEGGQVKRLAGGPPWHSPPQMAASGRPGLAYSEGRATGRYMTGLGVNWDLAPVVDVPTSRRAFIWRQGRAFSFNPATVATYATQFALGLQSARTAATAKHFPGVGSATVDTDNQLDVLRPSRRQLDDALRPYRALVPRGLDTVMLSTAAFPAYDSSPTPTALSRRIVQGLLRGRLGFRGVTITDALGTPTGHDEVTAGVLAARAGADVLLYTDGAPGELRALEASLRRGTLSRREALDAYHRIVALKRRLGAG